MHASTCAHTQELSCFYGLELGIVGKNKNCINNIIKYAFFYNLVLKDFIYLFIQRGQGRAKERERNINVWLPLMCPLLGIWPATQACALTGNQTSDHLVCWLALNPLSHTSKGFVHNFLKQYHVYGISPQQLHFNSSS